jgi:UDP-N-acetylmuramoyl-tripeptide--D-alanyl-D-alanine ligase
MPELTLAQLAEATGGELRRGDPESTVDSYVINTRALRRGGAFFALKGKRTDGHRFIADAARRKATVAITESEPDENKPSPPALIRVEDTRAALGHCGTWLRSFLGHAKWIALTGSNGKTTTKELLASGLSATRKTHRTLGNFNNDLGVPLTLLGCPASVETIVLELGMNAAGEIAELTRMTDPDIGMITNVRAVHLEHFHTLDDIAAAKGELFALLRDDAVAVVNLDDPQVRVQATRHVGKQVTFGQHARADVRLERIVDRFTPGAGMVFSHDGKRYEAQLSLGGSHAAFDALAAFAAMVAAGEEIGPAIERVEQLEPGPGRGQIHRLGGRRMLVDDSYNSSPAALASVLETLRATQAEGRKVLVMGDMLELGNVEGAMHREAGKRAAAAGVQMFVAVGPLSRQSADSARRAGVGEVHLHPDSAKCAASLAEYIREGDLIIVKGSRGMRMEKVVEALVATFEVDG